MWIIHNNSEHGRSLCESQHIDTPLGAHRMHASCALGQLAVTVKANEHFLCGWFCFSKCKQCQSHAAAKPKKKVYHTSKKRKHDEYINIFAVFETKRRTDYVNCSRGYGKLFNNIFFPCILREKTGVVTIEASA